MTDPPVKKIHAAPREYVDKADLDENGNSTFGTRAAARKRRIELAEAKRIAAPRNKSVA